MEKIDFKKKYPELYKPSSKFVQLITVPKMSFLMIDGKGDPNKSQFHKSIQCLTKISFALKSDLKKNKPENYFDYVIPPLEGLWWSESGIFNQKKKSDWRWTLMIMQVPYISAIQVQQKINFYIKDDKSLPFKNCRFEVYNENLSVQIMHIGSYQNEGPSVEKINKFMNKNNLKPHKHHHEIYISDSRRTAIDRLKTIIRQPVTR